MVRFDYPVKICTSVAKKFSTVACRSQIYIGRQEKYIPNPPRTNTMIIVAMFLGRRRMVHQSCSPWEAHPLARFRGRSFA